jgi:hypothetical protein
MFFVIGGRSAMPKETSMKKLTNRQKAHQVRRKEGLNKRRIKSRDKRKVGKLRQISGEES